jgi:hypothetical protein
LHAGGPFFNVLKADSSVLLQTTVSLYTKGNLAGLNGKAAIQKEWPLF